MEKMNENGDFYFQNQIIALYYDHILRWYQILYCMRNIFVIRSVKGLPMCGNAIASFP